MKIIIKSYRVMMSVTCAGTPSSLMILMMLTVLTISQHYEGNKQVFLV